eukprot:CAMPEP_0198561902 /NCGR_PEP_ID=MMETSP1462-20131121/96243_1 /TAXON_ID=1333877 /ORGANISM="Brandtodinium nutriculum, Strain RCC3387" /LENGTH=67 /DNA_ID=CAMNT_0044292815 /DNA_START=39 /DNA_END=239 /DNA_ORIENTATION=+
MTSAFFCHICGAADLANNISNPAVARVLGGKSYPQRGDWGCTRCGVGMMRKDEVCTHCGKVGRDSLD